MLLGDVTNLDMTTIVNSPMVSKNITVDRGKLTVEGLTRKRSSRGAIYATKNITQPRGSGGGSDGSRDGATRSADTRTCFACGKPGHVIANCRDELVKEANRLNQKGRHDQPTPT